MAHIYIVSCYSPPSALKITSGQTIRVEGWKTGNNILAKSIVNVTKSGPTCNCGMPLMKALIGAKVALEGKVWNIRWSSVGVQFDLKT